MAIYRPIFGDQSVALANLYHNIGGLYHARGEYVAGIPWARRAYETRCAILGKDHPDAVADAVALAGLLDEGGPSEESATIYQEALAVWERLYGSEHHEIASTLHNLAALRRDQGREAEATELFRRAYEMKYRILGGGSPDTALSGACLAELLSETGHREDARVLAGLALEAYRSNCEPGHPERVACEQLVARLE